MSLTRRGASSPLLLLVAAAVAPATAAAQQGRVHELPLEPATVHWGYYDASLEPVLTVRSGDRVRFGALVARGLERLEMAGADPGGFPPALVRVEEGVTQRGPGAHPMSGPIRVEGAEPGDAVEVRFEEIGYLSTDGVSGFLPGGGTLPDAFPWGALRLFRLDTVAGVARMVANPRVAVPLRPFFGSVGVAPPVLSGRVSSRAPGPWVGNLDNKELVEGTRLFLPVHVPGALLSIGDGHAAQGDGEVSGTAVEASLGGTVQVVLHRGAALRWPRAETPTHWISMGLDPDLDEAARMAVREMIDFLVAEQGLSREDAYVLCSVALDLRVTQLVDGTKGVHGMLAKDVLR